MYHITHHSDLLGKPISVSMMKKGNISLVIIMRNNDSLFHVKHPNIWTSKCDEELSQC